MNYCKKRRNDCIFSSIIDFRIVDFDTMNFPIKPENIKILDGIWASEILIFSITKVDFALEKEKNQNQT